MDSANRAHNQASGAEHRGVGLLAGTRAPSEGVNLADLEPLTTLIVRTANTLYRVVVVRGMSVLIKGGRSFPEIRNGDLLSFGTSGLRFGWIGVGLRMEIHSGSRCIVTSPVCEVSIEPRMSPARPQ
jgi:hypothetical protein